MASMLVECFVALEVDVREGSECSSSRSSLVSLHHDANIMFNPRSLHIFPCSAANRSLCSNIHMFCYPNSGGRPRDSAFEPSATDNVPDPRYHEFVLTDETGVQWHAGCLRTRKISMAAREQGSVTGAPAEMNLMPKKNSQSQQQAAAQNSSDGQLRHAAFCFISRHACYDTFRSLLHEFYEMSIPEQSAQPQPAAHLEDFVFAVIHEVIRPPPSFIHCTIPLPRANRTTTICNLPSTQFPPQLDFSILPLFETLAISHVIFVWSYLLLEQPVAVHSNSPSLLVRCCESFRALLAPLEWQTVFIPLVPYELADIIEAPTTFLIGGLSSWMKSRPIPEGVLCVDLDGDVLKLVGPCMPLLPWAERLASELRKLLHPILPEMDTVADFSRGEGVVFVFSGPPASSRAKGIQSEIRAVFFRWFADVLHTYRAFYDSDGHFMPEKWAAFFPDDQKAFMNEFGQTMMLRSWAESKAFILKRADGKAHPARHVWKPNYFDRLLDQHLGLPKSFRRDRAESRLSSESIGRGATAQHRRPLQKLESEGAGSTFSLSAARLKITITVHYSLRSPRFADESAADRNPGGEPRKRHGGREGERSVRPSHVFCPNELSCLFAEYPCDHQSHPSKAAASAISKVMGSHELVSRDNDALEEMHNFAERMQDCLHVSSDQSSDSFENKDTDDKTAGVRIANASPTTMLTTAISLQTNTKLKRASLANARTALADIARKCTRRRILVKSTSTNMDNLQSASTVAPSASDFAHRRAVSTPSLHNSWSSGTNWLWGMRRSPPPPPTFDPSSQENVNGTAETLVEEEASSNESVLLNPLESHTSERAEDALTTGTTGDGSSSRDSISGKFLPKLAHHQQGKTFFLNIPKIVTAANPNILVSPSPGVTKGADLVPSPELPTVEGRDPDATYESSDSASQPECTPSPGGWTPRSPKLGPGSPPAWNTGLTCAVYTHHRGCQKDLRIVTSNSRSLSIASMAGLEEWRNRRRSARVIHQLLQNNRRPSIANLDGSVGSRLSPSLRRESVGQQSANSAICNTSLQPWSKSSTPLRRDSMCR